MDAQDAAFLVIEYIDYKGKKKVVRKLNAFEKIEENLTDHETDLKSQSNLEYESKSEEEIRKQFYPKTYAKTKLKLMIWLIILIPIFFALVKGVKGDLLQAKLARMDYTELVTEEMLNEACDGEDFTVETYAITRDSNGYYGIELDGCNADGTRAKVFFFEQPKRVKEYGAMESNSKWTYVYKEDATDD